MIAFIVSGNSVAIGLSSSASNCGGRPISGPSVASWATKVREAMKITSKASPVWSKAIAVDGTAAWRWKVRGSRSPSSSPPWPPISWRM